MKEGFWYWELEPHLPIPKPTDEVWAKEEFLEKLEKVENEAQKVHYKGFSLCRICNKINGTITFNYYGWSWPSGYRHYIESHKVKPSEEFQKFIMQK